MAAINVGTSFPLDLWFAIPPGWIELVAHTNDIDSARWFDRLLALTPDLLDISATADVRSIHAAVRDQMPRNSVDAAGVLFTTLAAGHPTIWQFTVTQIPTPPAGDINVMAVVERFMATPDGRELGSGEGNFTESFVTPDGRDGVAVHSTTTVDDGNLKSHVQHAEPQHLGVVCAAVRLQRVGPSNGDRLALVTAVCPRVEERATMALVAAQITMSAQLRPADAPDLPGRVDVDTTGRRRDVPDRLDGRAPK